ncbi:MAG: hypothetical protein HY758_07675 [Nitrospirae bacterium]|nr:hypothetical protein [Nitrospirota bacterium]
MRQFTFFLTCAVLIGCSSPAPTGTATGEIDTSIDPQQIQTTGETAAIIIKLKKGEFYLNPLAHYSINAIVVGKESYSFGWQAELAPLDLALAWGKLAYPDTDKYVSFSQSERWYYFEYKNSSPFSAAFITSHSSNSHIIPANENIRLAVEAINKKDRITITGFLVNVSGTYEGMKFRWDTSLSRNDSGEGSCEVFYVTKVSDGNYVYE